MFQHTDQLNNVISLKSKPKRIISLVPSQSEFLWDLGLRSELVGITKFCIHPIEMFTSIERVGGTKALNLDKIRQLKPDLIIGNKEENDHNQINELQKEFNVWMSDIYNFDDAFGMMRAIGNMCGKKEEVKNSVANLQLSCARTKNVFPLNRVAYFIWNNPYMVAGNNTFIDSVLNHLGFINVFGSFERYPLIDDEMLKVHEIDICFLSSEPFPFKDEHVKELQNKLPNTKIMLVDGEMFSWYGSRLLHLENYIKELKERIDA